MSKIKEKISQIHQLKEDEIELFLTKCQQRIYKRNEFILEAGKICKGVFFVDEGLIGVYDINESGKICYHDFFFPKSFATDITSLSKSIPSENWLVAIQPTRVLYCTKESLLELYEMQPNFQTFGRKLLEELLLEKTAFNKVLSTLSAREKYDYLLANESRMIKELPVKYLASYLGVARETLSRIRKKE